jgi:hypothetical protein
MYGHNITGERNVGNLKFSNFRASTSFTNVLEFENNSKEVGRLRPEILEPSQKQGKLITRFTLLAESFEW